MSSKSTGVDYVFRKRQKRRNMFHGRQRQHTRSAVSFQHITMQPQR
jgi:hypothetical protein